jgi:CRISPR-associated endonuclease Csn1
MVKALADHSRRKELAFLQEGFPDPETGEIVNPAAFESGRQHFPEPWPHFRHELQSRLFTDDLAKLKEDLRQLGTYSEEDLSQLRTVFVSRAPQRRNGGAVHKDTIYSRPHPDHRLMVEEKSKEGKTRRRATDEELKGMVVERFDVFATADKGKRYRLNVSMLSDVVGADRNAWMIHALQLWLAERGDDPKKPGTKDYPRKPMRGNDFNGPFTGPEIKSVKVNAGRATGFAVRNGLAENERMIRVDVFAKGGKFHLVPVYVHHRVTGLPNRAIVAFKDEQEWTHIDETFKFLFSAYPNDLIRVTLKKEKYLGYYSSTNRSTGAVNLWAHDRSTATGKDGLFQSIGVKTAVSLEKFNVDVLGHIYPAPPEVRRGLA